MKKKQNKGHSVYLRVAFIAIIVVHTVATNQGWILLR